MDRILIKGKATALGMQENAYDMFSVNMTDDVCVAMLNIAQSDIILAQKAAGILKMQEDTSYCFSSKTLIKICEHLINYREEQE